MLVLMAKLICAIMVSISGFCVIKQILKSNERLLNLKNIALILLSTIPTLLFYQTQYNITISIITFFWTIVTYKFIFKLSITQSIITTGILMIMITFSDVIVSVGFSFVITVEQMRSNAILMIITNFLVGLIAIIISCIPNIKDRLNKFINNLEAKKIMTTIVFLVSLIVVISAMLYNISITFSTNDAKFNNALIVIIFFVLAWFYIKEQNSFNKLNHEYEVLFNYVQDFEDWVESEQLNRHELKNSLGSIRNITEDKQVIEKIDEILNDNIRIEETWIEQLKYLPKGTLKGLLYYKMAVARKNKITVITDVSPKTKSYYKKLTNDDWKVLGQLMGIYLDNAIEESAKPKKKKISIEIYIMNKALVFVIANTFRGKIDFQRINDKGYTTKGSGHGNGLYYAQKLIKHKNFESRQQIINDYYIQTLIIKFDKK